MDEDAILELDPEEDIDPMRSSLAYLMAAYEETEAKNLRASHRDPLKQWIIDNGEEDENGNFRYYFDSPVTLFGDPVYGLMAQRRVSEMVDEEEVIAIAANYGVLDQVLVPVTYDELDLDKFYALNQQGIIPDDEMDKTFIINEIFALTKITEG